MIETIDPIWDTTALSDYENDQEPQTEFRLSHIRNLYQSYHIDTPKSGIKESGYTHV